MLADISAIIGSLDIVFGEIDRWPDCLLRGEWETAYDRYSG
jgi:hypothetical protein